MSQKTEQITKYIGRAFYNADGQMIFSDNEKGETNHIADIRGWGAIQYLFEDDDEAMKFQDEIGIFIVDAINEKIERESKARKGLQIPPKNQYNNGL